ncbi:MAG: hypothetical protein C0154_11135 [Mucilaginibacter sp.]|uniref:hypothetical protein n=2 Tax=unclassified Mucilaginibacter TaxID=2617802 RepID=UPI00095FD582|nr:hypothetical protein [Mucilaginibacter sp. 44-25]OJW13816.1 MAG: hypothetical protein BGO48_03600 [Mucilaginibacter sp. 44-25]PLW89521.1 MAG: hypothetical protein C0154_11135 [Mucilaginibacter sp.]HEK20388.1 hypothetical protein [Bacteroidota bacterium]
MAAVLHVKSHIVIKYMLTQSFQYLLISIAFIILSFLIMYGYYCRRRYNSFYGTGRIADMEIWRAKSNVAWLFTFCLAMALLFHLV